MAVTAITFESGTGSFTVAAPFKVRLSNDPVAITEVGDGSVRATAHETGITVLSPLVAHAADFKSPVLFEHAMLSLTGAGGELHNYVATIDATAPAASGDFFISGSECTGWMYKYSGNAIQDGVIRIADMCVPCTDCGYVMNLRKWAEYYRIVLNVFKDASLYHSGVYSNRHQWLTEGSSGGYLRRIGVGTGCAPYLDSGLGTVTGGQFVDADFNVSQAYRLMYEYAAAVQMWNYAVTASRNTTEIVTAPETANGFVVRSKFAVPECSNATVRCSIEVYVDNVNAVQTNLGDNIEAVNLLSGNTPLSMRVEPGVMVNKPFNESVQTSGTAYHDGKDSVPSSYPASVRNVFLHSTGKCPSLHKLCTYECSAGPSGTFEVQAKFIPFLAIMIKRPVIKVYSYFRSFYVKGSQTARAITLAEAMALNPGADYDDITWCGGSQWGKDDPLAEIEIRNRGMAHPIFCYSSYTKLESTHPQIPEGSEVQCRDFLSAETSVPVASTTEPISFSEIFTRQFALSARGRESAAYYPTAVYNVFYDEDSSTAYESARQSPSKAASRADGEQFNRFQVRVTWSVSPSSGSTTFNSSTKTYTYQTVCCREFSREALAGIFEANSW